MVEAVEAVVQEIDGTSRESVAVAVVCVEELHGRGGVGSGRRVPKGIIGMRAHGRGDATKQGKWDGAYR